MKLLFSILVVILFQGEALAQEGSREALLEKQLREERMVRIVEPAIYLLYQLQDDEYVTPEDVRVLWDICGLGGRNAIMTPRGQAWTGCAAEPESVIFYHGNSLDHLWGDRTITITVQGFDTHQPLCWLNDDGAGVSDTRQPCETAARKLRDRFKALVVAQLTLTTKVIRYTKKEEVARKKLYDSQGGVLHTSAGPLSIRLIKEGEIKNWELKFSPITYTFSEK